MINIIKYASALSLYFFSAHAHESVCLLLFFNLILLVGVLPYYVFTESTHSFESNEESRFYYTILRSN